MKAWIASISAGLLCVIVLIIFMEPPENPILAGLIAGTVFNIGFLPVLNFMMNKP
jgi:hypothetical protein